AWWRTAPGRLCRGLRRRSATTPPRNRNRASAACGTAVPDRRLLPDALPQPGDKRRELCPEDSRRLCPAPQLPERFLLLSSAPVTGCGSYRLRLGRALLMPSGNVRSRMPHTGRAAASSTELACERR